MRRLLAMALVPAILWTTLSGSVAEGDTAPMLVLPGASAEPARPATTAGPITVDLCLVGIAAPGVTLTDAAEVHDAIATGTFAITDVVPCDPDTPIDPSPAPAVPADLGRWLPATHADPQSGEPLPFAFLGPIATRGQKKATTRLTVMCFSDGTTWLGLTLGVPVVDKAALAVTVRLDGGAPETDLWLVFEGQQTAIWFDEMRSDADAVPFLLRMMAAETLVLETTSKKGTTVSATFELTGMTAAMAAIRAACGW